MADARAYCLAGAAAGALLAMVSLFWPASQDRPVSPVVARINGHLITDADLQLALDAMARDSRNVLPEDASDYALARLIDEELLYQRAIELDLPRNASTIRRSVVIAMIDSILARADLEPTDAELRALFAAEPERFSGEVLLRIDWRSGPAAGNGLMRPASHPPDRLISASDLRRYLGAELAQSALALAAGETMDIVTAGERRHQLTVIERVDPVPAGFDQQRDAVTALWRERGEEAALESYLADLRDRASIAIQAD
ncbi:hypothetical protein AWH62_01410 [Maricaulis sp. W15]|uniref:hypothetical protein n=1 Tax=Maricaulis sp. W15 TaxID=1772333 RepID=UPI0009490319|nr:hypothetical protein [Maricaulis sp. W15]OLF81358.1 hypothetical protein AWH62_01410 [Maricaulis sp. W15]